jgi:hypothetical protein
MVVSVMNHSTATSLVTTIWRWMRSGFVDHVMDVF